MLLRAMLEDALEHGKTAHIFGLDLAKFFDSPDQDVIAAGAHAAGIPASRIGGDSDGSNPGTFDLIAEYLHQRDVHVRTPKGMARPAAMEAGFAQGDCFSCFCCNLVIVPLLRWWSKQPGALQ